MLFRDNERLSPVPGESDLEASEQGQLQRGGNQAVLVVEDEPSLLLVALAYLDYLGYQTLSAHNADQALQQIEQQPFIDLIFSDVVMPGALDGFQLALTARQRFPDVKILLTSGCVPAINGYLDDEDSFLRDLASNLLPKPYTIEQLAEAMYLRLR